MNHFERASSGPSRAISAPLVAILELAGCLVDRRDRAPSAAVDQPVA